MNGYQYLLQVNIYLALFYLFYVVLLKHETFFTLNRIYLISAAIISFFIPILQSEWLRALFIAEQVSNVVTSGMQNFLQLEISASADETYSLSGICVSVYLTVVLLLTLNLCRKLFFAFTDFRTKTDNLEAYSFFKFIRVSNQLQDRETIYKHEQVHAFQWHSADVILYEIVAIINWFNPIIYLYKRTIKQIHEFIADEKASANHKSKADYALILISHSFGVPINEVTNNFFNQSLLKKRLTMLNKTKSKKAALLKYGLSVPLFMTMLILSSAAIKKANVIGISYNSVLSTKTPGKIDSLSDDALYIINGKPTTKAKFKEINPKSIKSVNVLKGSSAIEKYGEKGKYGVLEVAMQDSYGMITYKDGLVDFASLDAQPSYPGGMREFYKYIGSNYKYPKDLKEHGVSGRVVVTFIVEKNGTLSSVKVLKDLGYGSGEEAIRVLKQSPNWISGMKNGQAVRVAYTVPISLSLNDSNSKAGQNVALPNALYIVDGLELTSESVKKIDPKNIVSINVIKGDDATKKYGDKGKGGVIVITTKTANKD